MKHSSYLSFYMCKLEAFYSYFRKTTFSLHRGNAWPELPQSCQVEHALDGACVRACARVCACVCACLLVGIPQTSLINFYYRSYPVFLCFVGQNWFFRGENPLFWASPLGDIGWGTRAQDLPCHVSAALARIWKSIEKSLFYKSCRKMLLVYTCKSSNTRNVPLQRYRPYDTEIETPLVLHFLLCICHLYSPIEQILVHVHTCTTLHAYQ